ncbi:hypothetical protein MFU01_59290 [Myxococcus fulvus]|uniref:Uncharacterized protein n=1 Tax=Myxococcus fulvus TaxID=33 RepID=A0A511TBR6_MYXFU|nr:hypothetical protein [Myxococcus fulvus]GEN10892.1 hypothetical protein MFU01_59290 [Myxococcus fulvus]
MATGGFLLWVSQSRGAIWDLRPPEPTTVYLPISRVEGPSGPMRTFEDGIDVRGRVLDARGRPVARGFVSFTLPEGPCGNAPRMKGRVAFTGGVFRVELPHARFVTVVAEDGRATSVRVAPGLFRRVEVTAVLPDHPTAPSGADAVLPWAPPTESLDETPERRSQAAAPAGPPRTACEYLAGARFETVEVPSQGAREVEFPATSPGELTLDLGRFVGSYPVDCDGWNLVKVDRAEKTARRVGHVEPSTGRLVFEGVEYLRAGPVHGGRVY